MPPSPESPPHSQEEWEDTKHPQSKGVKLIADQGCASGRESIRAVRQMDRLREMADIAKEKTLQAAEIAKDAAKDAIDGEPPTPRSRATLAVFSLCHRSGF